MLRAAWWGLVLCASLLPGLGPGGGNALAQPPAPAGPGWSRLVFEGETLLAEARSRVDLAQVPAAEARAGFTASGRDDDVEPSGGPVWIVDVRTVIDSAVADMTVSSRVWLEAGGVALERIRLRERWKPTRKLYRFTRGGVHRLRRKPAQKSEEDLLVEAWSSTKPSFYPYPPAAAGCAQISEPSAVLLLLAPLAVSPDGAEPLCLFNKKQLLRVEVAVGGPKQIEVDYVEKSAAGEQRRSGRRAARRVSLRGQSLHTAAAEREPLAFLELQGDVDLWVDAESGLLLGVEGGVASLPGRMEFALREVTLDAVRETGSDGHAGGE